MRRVTRRTCIPLVEVNFHHNHIRNAKITGSIPVEGNFFLAAYLSLMLLVYFVRLLKLYVGFGNCEHDFPWALGVLQYLNFFAFYDGILTLLSEDRPVPDSIQHLLRGSYLLRTKSSSTSRL